MKKNKIKKLATISYKGNNLDQKRVSRIVKVLTRAELREYLREIKRLESNKTVKVFIAKKIDLGNIKKKAQNMFPGKKIIVKEDKSLIAGMKITVNDTVYDFNLKNELGKIVSYISQ